jgi:hypothetical protein
VAVVGTIVVELPTLLRWAASGGISQAADGTPLASAAGLRDQGCTA